MRKMKDILAEIDVEASNVKPVVVIEADEKDKEEPVNDSKEKTEESEGSEGFDAEIDLDVEMDEYVDVASETPDVEEPVESSAPSLLSKIRQDIIDASFTEYVLKDDKYVPYIIGVGIVIFAIMIANSIINT